MTDPDTNGPRTGDIAAVLALLTRFPLPNADHTRGAAAAWAFPLAGLAVGGIAALTGLLALGLGLPSAIAAGLTLAASILVTGAMHEDGLADSADGLWGGWDRTRRLEIMRDSHIGTYGVLALVMSVALRWAALSTLFAAGHVAAPILAAAVLSRAPMTALLHALPPARNDGLSQSTGSPSRRSVGLAAVLALILGLLATGLAVVPIALAIAATTLAVAAIAKTKIGGQTGDILGATQQTAEIAALATMAAILT